MNNIFQFLENKKGKKILLEIKLLNKIPLSKEDLVYNDDLELTFSNITYLPDNLVVNGYLILLANEIIKKLPNNLTINGDLNLYGSIIEKIPKKLKVYGDLNLFGCEISLLPDDLYVNGDLDIRYTPLADKIKNDVSLLKKYKQQVKGKICYE